ncbi:MAG TPA: PspC domain-containing protein [Actinopolymorphaceae bacterium]
MNDTTPLRRGGGDPSNIKKLVRTRDDRMIAGVCGGIGRYVGLDPVVVRLGMVVLALVWGLGLVIYLAAWIIVPEEEL